MVIARASRKKGDEPRRGDLTAPLCPSRGVLDHLTSRWAVLVLVILSDGMRRFSELRREAAGVSEKMLSQTLRDLEADGFVDRKSFAEVPPRVEYNLTAMGREVAAHVHALATWIEDNMPRVEVARARKGRAARPRPG